MKKLKDLEKLLKKSVEFEPKSTPATDEQIAGAEEQLGVVFPAEFKSFLRSHNLLCLCAWESLGLVQLNAPSHPNLVWLTLESRRNGLPHQLVKLTDQDDGDQFDCVDTSEKAAVVVVWDCIQKRAQPHRKPLFDFLIEEIEQAIEMEKDIRAEEAEDGDDE